MDDSWRVETDDELHEAGLARVGLLRRFASPHAEQEYATWKAELLRLRLFLLLLVSFLAYSVGAAAAIFNEHSYKAAILRKYPSQQALLLGSTIAARVFTLGCLLVVGGSMVGWCRPTQYLLSGKRYPGFVMISFLVPLFIEVIPVLATSTQSTIDSLAPPLNATDNLSTSVITSLTCYNFNDGDASVVAVDAAHAVRGAYWNALLTDLYFSFGGGMSGLSLVPRLMLGLVATPMLHAYLEVFWRATDASRGPFRWSGTEWHQLDPTESLIPLYFRLFPFIAMLVIGGMQERALREEFRYRRLLKYAKDARIEQLVREKERLDWDRKLRLATSPPAIHTDGTLPRPPPKTEALSTPCAPVAEAAADTAHLTHASGDAVLPATLAASIRPAPANEPSGNIQLSPPLERAQPRCACAAESDAGTSAVSSAAGELGTIWGVSASARTASLGGAHTAGPAAAATTAAVASTFASASASAPASTSASGCASASASAAPAASASAAHANANAVAGSSAQLVSHAAELNAEALDAISEISPAYPHSRASPLSVATTADTDGSIDRLVSRPREAALWRTLRDVGLVTHRSGRSLSSTNLSQSRRMQEAPPGVHANAYADADARDPACS